MLVYGFDGEPARTAWADACLTAVKTGFVDSCFSDRSTEDNMKGLTPEVQAAYAAGHQQVQQGLQASLDANGQGGFVVANNGVVPKVKASMFESFGADNSSIAAVMQYIASGRKNATGLDSQSQFDQSYLIEVHAGYHPDGSDNKCQDGVTNSLSAFLIAAQDNSYYACASDWVVSRTDRQWVTWWPEYSKPLGPPKADATYDVGSSTWTREFGAGTVVTFDAKTGTGMIKWSDGTVSEGTTA